MFTGRFFSEIRSSWGGYALVCACVGLLAGCANPGPPKAPSLHLPKPVTALSSQRTGDRVLLTFTVPADTTDGGKPEPPFTAVVCRQPLAAHPQSISAEPPPCNEVRRLAVVPGPTQAQDDLPAVLTAGSPTLLAYRIDLRNQKGRSAGPSTPVYALAGSAPAPAGPLAFAAQRNGALITWQPVPASPAAPMRLTRTLVATATGPVASRPAKKAKVQPPVVSEKNRPRESTLIAKAEAGRQTDPGGMIDRSVQDGDTLTYTAQRVLTVQLLAPAPEPARSEKKTRSTRGPSSTAPFQPTLQTFELRGEPSPPLMVSFHDTIPPVAPTGLAAIPGGGFGQPSSIDLSWVPNPETDLLGYNVYRAEAVPAGSDAFTRLNGEPASGPAYRDLTAQPGHIYLYRVTAVDQRHNESPPTPEIREQLHP